ncbi:MAG: hypothetical protein KKE11_01020, partial [Gammaproteobacteria bacterium]|nr:hypothetical protein [Gammaproteobacteria bacterium]
GLFATNRIITGKLLHSIKTYPVQQVQVHDLAAISLEKKNPIFPEYILSGTSFNMHDLRRIYTPANVGELLFYHNKVVRLTNDPANIKELNFAWWRGVYEHPWSYLQHRVNVFGYLLSGCTAFWDDVCRPSLANINYQPGFIYDLYCRLTVNGPLKFLFHTWVYVINSLVILAVVVRLQNRLADSRSIIYVVLSGLLYVMGSFFAAPACEFRYIYWEVIASLFALSLLIKNIFMMDANES